MQPEDDYARCDPVAPRRLTRLLLAAAVMALACANAGAVERHGQEKRVNPDAKAIAEFQEEVEDYVELQRKLEPPSCRRSRRKPRRSRSIRTSARWRALIQSARRSERRATSSNATSGRCSAGCSTGVFKGPDGKTAAHGRDGREPRPGGQARRSTDAISGYDPALEHAAANARRPCRRCPRSSSTGSSARRSFCSTPRAHIIVDYMTGAVPR